MYSGNNHLFSSKISQPAVWAMFSLPSFWNGPSWRYSAKLLLGSWLAQVDHRTLSLCSFLSSMRPAWLLPWCSVKAQGEKSPIRKCFLSLYWLLSHWPKLVTVQSIFNRMKKGSISNSEDLQILSLFCYLPHPQYFSTQVLPIYHLGVSQIHPFLSLGIFLKISYHQLSLDYFSSFLTGLPSATLSALQEDSQAIFLNHGYY